MMKTLVPALSFALALSACSDTGEQPTEPAASETAMPVEPDGGIGDGAGPPPGAADTIPAAFLGVWDYIEGTCNPASDLRIEIKPESMHFYESIGEVTGVEVEGADRIVVSLAMEGEGEKWEMSRAFTLSQGGERLTPTAIGDEQFEPMPLKRCPA